MKLSAIPDQRADQADNLIHLNYFLMSLTLHAHTPTCHSRFYQVHPNLGSTQEFLSGIGDTLARSKRVRLVWVSACVSRRLNSFGVRMAGAKNRRKRNPLMAMYFASFKRKPNGAQTNIVYRKPVRSWHSFVVMKTFTSLFLKTNYKKHKATIHAIVSK